MKDSSV
jgi:hypothetical protein